MCGWQVAGEFDEWMSGGREEGCSLLRHTTPTHNAYVQ